jgi:DNA (cytosine-5)-methyltransferase 1
MNDRLPLSIDDWVVADLSVSLRSSQWPKESFSKAVNPLRVMDLFSGCGGLTLGAFQASRNLKRGFEVALAVDSSATAVDVYRENFAPFSKQILSENICEFLAGADYSKLSKAGQTLAEQLGNVDVLLAGPPCQGNSDLNNRSRRDDPRNDLYIVPAIFAQKVLPKFVLIENVPTVIHGATNVVARTKIALRKAGYSCHEFHADLTAFGLPQRRRRHVLVASLLHTESNLKQVLLPIATNSRNVPLAPFISDIESSAAFDGPIFSRQSRPSADNMARIDFLFDNDLLDLPNSKRPSCHRDKKHSYVSMYGRLDEKSPSQTITSGFGSMGQGRFVHPTQRRTITPHEAARIQGFPDYFSFRKTKNLTELRQMIANAVAPVVSSTLIAELIRSR